MPNASEVRRTSILLSVIAAVVAVASAGLAGCGGSDSSGSSSGGTDQPLQGTEWVLDQEASRLAIVTPSAVVTAQFGPDGRLAGNAGCNSYGTTYRVDGAQLTVSPQIASTDKLCGGRVGSVEQAYLARLPTAKSFAVDGRELTISTGTTPLVYRALDADTALAGSWVVTGYFRPGAITSPVPGSTLTAKFDAGHVAGSSGCNDYTGPYETDGTKIVIGPLASTLRACADPALSEQGSQYLAALDLARTFSIAGGNLTLLRADGGIAVTYAKA